MLSCLLALLYYTRLQADVILKKLPPPAVLHPIHWTTYYTPPVLLLSLLTLKSMSHTCEHMHTPAG
jgi:hypothetical protein